MTSVEGAADERVGPYRLLELLGEGGMGVVHRAVDQAGREVAVKLVRHEFAADEAFRDRLAREVDTMRRVHSPYVAEIVNADLQAERPYIVTRFIDGRPLDAAVRDSGPFTGGPLARIAVCLAEALAEIHSAGVVHRDLKPSNVMLVGGAPVVIDFGIAHAVGATRLTRTGMIVGTPGYMGPELIDGGRPGPALDVYGWAATMTYAATGHSPFGSGPLEAVVARIIAGDPDLRGVPPRLEPFLREALQREPDLRPSGARLAGRVRAADVGAPLPPAAVPPAAPARREQEAAGTPAPARAVDAPQRSRVPLRAYKPLAYLVIVAAAAVCAMYPILGPGGAVAAACYLRAADSAVRSRRQAVRGLGDLLAVPVRAPGSLAASVLVAVPCLLYAAVAAAVVTGMLLIPALHVSPDTVTLASEFVFGYVTLAGPGVRGPRRQTVRLLSAIARGRGATALTAVVLIPLAATAVRTAWVTGPHWWPLPSPYHVIGELIRKVPSLIRRR